MKPWYNIQARGADRAEITIDQEIGEYGVTARQFAADLRAIKAREIALRLFTPGGSVVQGFAIYNALLRHPARIVGQIDFAASMGTVIAMACDEIEMADNGFFMIHNPWTVAMGESDDLERMADLLDKMREKILDAYQRHSPLPRAELGAMMDAETWMDAGEAMAAGFCSRIVKAPALAALADLDLSAFTNLPQAIVTTKQENGAANMPDNKNKPADLSAKLEAATAELQAAAEAKAALTAQVEDLTAQLAEFKTTAEAAEAALAVEKKAHAESIAEAAAAAKSAAEAHAAAIAEKDGALAKAEAKVAALAPGLKPSAQSRADSNNGTAEGGAAIAEFNEAVAAIQARDNCGYNDALAKAQTEHADKFAAYLAAPKPNK